ncbi:MAG TPA: TRAP transporter small permease subunit [Pelomicrobium sp.]|nr:TRAP transporter small permease subunit [Pelomicrobium sp.]
MLSWLLRFLDRVTGTSGAVVAWLVIPLIAASCYEVFSRYVLNEPTLWAFEVGYMVMGTHFLVGMAYTLRENEHVRVDLLYARLSPRLQALVDTFTYVCLLLPLTLWLSVSLWDKVLKAYESQERSGMSAFNPLIWPYRAVFFTAFVLLSLQAIAQLIRCYQTLTGRGRDESDA